MQPHPHIFTFFSFKGGVGRTMAAVNAAYALAARGRDVLLVDMDIEAPGLSTFLRHQGELEGQSRGDVLDLLAWAKGHVAGSGEKANGEAGAAADAAPNLSQFVAAVPAKRIPKPRLGEPGRLDVLAVHDDRDYVRRLQRLGLGSSGRRTVVALSRALRACLCQARVSVDVPEYYGDAVPREKPYDYILVDSRTGLTEIGGLCVGPLADRLVVLVALNDQNVTWTERFLRTVGVGKARDEGDKPFDEADPPPSAPEAPPRLGPKPTVVVASPYPSGETDLARERLKVLERTLGTRVAARINYNALMAVKETVFVRGDYSETPLANDYRALADVVMACVNDHAAQLAALSTSLWNDRKDRVAAVEAALRLAPQSPETGLALLPMLHDAFRAGSDAEFVAADRMRRLLAAVPASRAVALGSWGTLLATWSAGTRDPELKALRSRESLQCYAAVLAMPDAPPEQKAMAMVNRGVAYGRAGKTDLAMADYAAVLAMPDAPREQKAMALFNRAVTYGQAGKTELELADYAAVLAMPDAPPEQKARALVNRGVAYGRAGKTELELADYAAVLAMPDAPPEQKARALGNTGWRHYQAGRYAESVAASKDALALNPSSTTNRANLGLALLHLARVEEARAEYGTTLAQIASPEDLDTQVVADLRAALASRPDLPGAKDILALAEARRRELGGAAPAS